MSSAFACPHCRHVIQSPVPVPAGQQVKCPKCSGYFLAPPTVPLPVAAIVPAAPVARVPLPPPPPLPRAAAVMPPPPPAAAAVPHKKHKKEKKHRRHRRDRSGRLAAGGGGLMKILIGALGLFLLMGAGAGAFLFLNSGGGSTQVAATETDEDDDEPVVPKKGKQKKTESTEVAAATKKKAEETKTETKKEDTKTETKKEEKKDPPAMKGPEDALVLVPADAPIIAGGNVKTLAENPTFKKIVEGPLAKLSADLKRDVGMELPEFAESAVMAFKGSPGNLAAAKTTLILKSNAAYDVKKLAESPAVAEKAEVKGRTYYKLKGDSGLAQGRKDAVLFAPSDRLLVISDLPKADFEKLIGGELGKPVLDETALTIVTELQKNPVWAYLGGGAKKELEAGLMADKAPEELKPAAKALAGAPAITFWAEPAEAATLLAAGLICANEDAAKEVVEALTAHWKLLKMPGGMMAKLPPEVDKLVAELKAGAEFAQKGQVAVLSATLPLEPLTGLVSSGEAGVKASYSQFLAGLAGPPPLVLSKDEQAVLELVNKAREAEKLPPLKVNRVLMKMARDHAANMAKQEKDDDTLDGKGHVMRLEDAGYKVKDKMSQANLVSAPVAVLKDPKIAVDAWLGDDASKKNILGKYEETGIGVGVSDKKVLYYYQVFAVPES